MRNNLLFILFLLALANVSSAQMVGTDVFLQGKWLEVGVDRMGAFGTCSTPPSYYAHNCYCTNICASSGVQLDAAYDWGHDGWTVGAPCFMGNYTIPGFPQEGWSIQVGATEYRNWASGAPCTGPFGVPGSITGYTNIAGNKTGTFTGNIAGLKIVQDTRVDTLASWVVVTARIYNTTAATIAGVYYERTCDPDNVSAWAGGSTTHNVIVHQNEDYRHAVQIGTYTTGNSYTTPTLTYNRWNSYLSLATKDCRAKCGTIAGLSPSNTPAQLWAGTGAVIKLLNDSNNNDVGIFLAYNIGSILPFDSAIVSYAYIYSGNSGIDSAFPEPRVSVAGIPFTPSDTLDGCMFVSDSLNIDLVNGDDKNFSWTKWTWTPGLGLSATTGAHNYIHLSALTGYVTYTITGTDSAGYMNSCHNRTLYLTVHACHQAVASDPCVGDTLQLNMEGDSTGASYYWTGPAGFISHIRNPFRYPTTWADTGTYRVIKTVGLTNDTDEVHVIFHPLPIVNATSNIPLNCDPFQNPLTLFASLDSAGETFKWMGPLGFTSTMQNPTIPGFDSTMSGIYTVTGTTVWGCKTTKTTSVIPGIKPAFDYIVRFGCVWDTVVFINNSYNADTYRWIFGDASPDVFSRHTMHVYKASNQIVTVKLNLDNSSSHCHNDISRNVDLRHEIHAVFDGTPDTLCLNNGALVSFTSTSYANDSTNLGVPASHVDWKFGDGITDLSGAASPTHTYTYAGVFPVTQIAYDAMGCMDSVVHPIYVVQLHVKSFHDTTLCISQPLQLHNDVWSTPEADWTYGFAWSQSEPNLDKDNVQIPFLSGIGKFTDILTITIPGIVPDGCPITDTFVVNSILGKKLSQLTVSQTIDYGESIQLFATNSTLYYWLPNDGSLDNNNINNPVASPKRTTTYTVFGFDDNGCRDSAYITVFVDTTMEQDIPSAFTPDGDGLNDVFKPVGIKFQHLVEFRVYNRWGQELYYTNNKEQGWDGTYHGAKQDMGVYNYLIIVAKPGQDNIVYKGNVTLIR